MPRLWPPTLLRGPIWASGNQRENTTVNAAAGCQKEKVLGDVDAKRAQGGVDGCVIRKSQAGRQASDPAVSRSECGHVLQERGGADPGVP